MKDDTEIDLNREHARKAVDVANRVAARLPGLPLFTVLEDPDCVGFKSNDDEWEITKDGDSWEVNRREHDPGTYRHPDGSGEPPSSSMEPFAYMDTAMAAAEYIAQNTLARVFCECREDADHNQPEDFEQFPTE